MANIFLHRVSYCQDAARPLLERNIVTIGWGDLIPYFPDMLRSSSVDEAFSKAWGTFPRNRWCLNRFLFEMKCGDRLLIPGWKTFSLYEITAEARPVTELTKADLDGVIDWGGNPIVLKMEGDAASHGLYQGDNGLDLGFFIRVKPIATDISRREYANSALTARMKIRNTNANISDLSSDIDEVISNVRNQAPINVYQAIQDKAADLVARVLLDQLTPDKFENLIANYFESRGAEVEKLPKYYKGKEGDCDVLARFPDLKTVYYIQAKFYCNCVASDYSVDQITSFTQDANGKRDPEDDSVVIPCIFTTAESFSDEVKASAKAKGVTLFCRKEIIAMFFANGFNPCVNL